MRQKRLLSSWGFRINFFFRARRTQRKPNHRSNFTPVGVDHYIPQTVNTMPSLRTTAYAVQHRRSHFCKKEVNTWLQNYYRSLEM